jgi:hypothetical protein
MKIEIDNPGELALLNKMFGYVKFIATDDDSAFISGSPLVNTLYDKITEELRRLGKGGKNIPDDLYLRDSDRIKKIIVIKLGNHTGWNSIGIESKKELVLNMIYPYRATETEIQEIINSVGIS